MLLAKLAKWLGARPGKVNLIIQKARRKVKPVISEEEEKEEVEVEEEEEEKINEEQE